MEDHFVALHCSFLEILFSQFAKGHSHFIRMTIVNRTAIGWVHSGFCTGFFCCCFVGVQMQNLHSAKSWLGLWVIQPVMFIHQKLLKHYGYCFRYKYKYKIYVLSVFCFIEVLDLKRILNMVIIHVMHWLAAFTFTMWQVRSCLPVLCKITFGRSDSH